MQGLGTDRKTPRMSKYERPNIRAMQGYTWGEQPQDARTIKLNTNENPYPVSARVQEALSGIDAASLRAYPQPTADRLRDAIAARHGLSREQIVVTNGGDEALRLAITTFVEPKAAFGMASPSYSLYPVLANIHDAGIVEVPLGDDWVLPEDLAPTLNAAGAELTCLVNPHAPSGTLTDTETLSRIAASLDGVLLIDEAYVDFVDPARAYDSTQLLETHDNVLILRTFSKGYSLAGLRLGYLLGSTELIAPIIGKTRDSYNIDHISQTVGLAAFEDLQHAATSWAQVRESRAHLVNALGQLGLQSPPSEANFVLATVPATARQDAAALYASLKAQGILVRYFDTARLDDKLRISIGTPEENDRLVAALTQALT